MIKVKKKTTNMTAVSYSEVRPKKKYKFTYITAISYSEVRRKKYKSYTSTKENS